MIGFSGVFLLAAWGFVSWFGSVGFIFANCVNMSVRICRSWLFIGAYAERQQSGAIDHKQESMTQDPDGKVIRGHPLGRPVVSATTTAGFGAALVLTKLSEAFFCCESGWPNRITHIAIGALSLLSLGCLAFVNERRFITDFRELFGKKTAAD